MAGVSPSLVKSLQLANGPGAQSIRLDGLSWNYDTVPPERLRTPTSQSLVRAFAESKGGGLVYLSRVGFNEDRNEALFCARGASTVAFHLRLEQGEWRVVSTD